MTAAQVDFEPCIHLWTPGKPLIRLPIPIVPGVVSREHVEEANQREDRANAFISKLEQDGEVSLSFESNIDKLLQNESDNVKQVVLQCCSR